jgi:hypothetical protein
VDKVSHAGLGYSNPSGITDGSSLMMTPGTITAHLAHLQHGSHIYDTPSKLSWWGSVDLLVGEQGVVAAMRSIQGACVAIRRARHKT